MAQNVSRSMNAELGEGMTDGKYIKLETNQRGGEVSAATAKARSHLNSWYYGGHEVSPKVRPDGVNAR